MKRLQLIAIIILLTVIGVLSLNRPEVPQAPKNQMELGMSPGSRILDLDPETLADDLDRMSDLNLTHLRLDFDWSRIERSAGEYDWSDLDRIVEAAESRNIAVHALVAYTPRWARPPGTTDKHPPTNPTDFGAFVATAAQRYSDRGVKSWEIWNEPNVASFWSASSGPNPQKFAALVTTASRSIRGIDPSAQIISGGLAPAVDTRGEELSPETFLEGFLASIEPGTIDAIGIHPYSYPASPGDTSKSWNLFGRLPQIQAFAAESTGEFMPLWITEYGAPTGTASRAVSQPTQERLVSDALGCANQTDWIEVLFLYNLRDRVDGDPEDIEDNFGLFASDGAPKLAATAVDEFQSKALGEPINWPCEDW